MVISSYLNRTLGSAWPSVETIARRLNASKRTVQTGLRALDSAPKQLTGAEDPLDRRASL